MTPPTPIYIYTYRYTNKKISGDIHTTVYNHCIKATLTHHPFKKYILPIFYNQIYSEYIHVVRVTHVKIRKNKHIIINCQESLCGKVNWD